MIWYFFVSSHDILKLILGFHYLIDKLGFAFYQWSIFWWKYTGMVHTCWSWHVWFVKSWLSLIIALLNYQLDWAFYSWMSFKNEYHHTVVCTLSQSHWVTFREVSNPQHLCGIVEIVFRERIHIGRVLLLNFYILRSILSKWCMVMISVK